MEYIQYVIHNNVNNPKFETLSSTKLNTYGYLSYNTCYNYISILQLASIFIVLL